MGDTFFGFLGLDFAKRHVKNAIDAAAKIVSDECDHDAAQSENVTELDIEFAVCSRTYFNCVIFEINEFLFSYCTLSSSTGGTNS